jgi:hypothetical protein
MDILSPEKFQEAIKLSDTHPFEQINMLLQSWIGLVCERGSNYFLNASFSRSCSEEPWIYPIAGNDSQAVWRWLWQAANLR